ncbi:MAG TPA: hypothetical protein VJ741_15880 [Solirubrobacteraceae bacterium]|nr:hypothetical protein [Solirubrobacteraceae bacterium]
MKLKRLTAAPALALVLAACGATPPQAPPKQAMKLSVATGGISTTCGLTYQATAFPGNRRAALETLEAKVSLSVNKLASVYARNPAWIYQSETVHDIVRDALAMLDSCGLTKAQRALAHATYARSQKP